MRYKCSPLIKDVYRKMELSTYLYVVKEIQTNLQHSCDQFELNLFMKEKILKEEVINKMLTSEIQWQLRNRYTHIQ